MFGNSYGYEALDQKDSAHVTLTGPGLFSSAHYGQKGHSFDYVPRVNDNDFTDRSQGCFSRICHLIVIFLVSLCTFITFPVSGWFVLKVVPNYERIVFFRLGRIRPPKGPGMVVVLPLIDQWQRVDLRTRAFNIPPCKVSTRDGGLVSVGADIQFRIWSPVMSVVAVQDLNSSTRLTAQNAMTQSLSKKTVREIQTDRVKLGDYLGMDINEITKPWGLEVDRVELTLEAVLKGPDGVANPSPLAGHSSAILPGMEGIPGLGDIAGPMQHLAMQFLGNMSMAQSPKDSSTLAIVNEVTSEHAPPEQMSSAEQLLLALTPLLSERLVQTIGACYQFNISSDRGHTSTYYLDLSQGSGSCGEGSSARAADVVFTLSEVDLLTMVQGRLKPLAAYTCGRLGVEGDINVAMRLEELIKTIREGPSHS